MNEREDDLLYHDGEDDEILLTVDQNGIRLDKYVADVTELTRTFIQRLVDEDRVYVEGQVAKASKKVQTGQLVRIILPAPSAPDTEPQDIPLDIVYEDKDLLVVNKPRGMVVHPAPGHTSGTLVNALLWHFDHLSTRSGHERPGIVHRIDKDTSGLLVVAKTDLAHLSLSEQLKDHSMTRIYHAVVHGVFNHHRGRVDAPIGRHPNKRQQMAVREDGSGRSAITHFHVLETFSDYTYLELRLETGRTHQIRVHMAYIGHPVVGDPVYATKDPFDLKGQALHAGTLGFVHPRTGDAMLFTSSLPEPMVKLLDILRAT